VGVNPTVNAGFDCYKNLASIGFQPVSFIESKLPKVFLVNLKKKKRKTTSNSYLKMEMNGAFLPVHK